MSLIGGSVATRSAAHHEVRVVGRDVAAVDAGDATDAAEVVVPQLAAPGQELLGRRVDDAHAVAVLAVDLPAGVHDEQLALVVGELELRHAELAVDADAAGELVVEGHVDRAGSGVHRGEAGAELAVDPAEPAADVQRRVGGGQRGRLVVGALGEGEGADRCTGREVEAGDLLPGHPADGVEVAGDEQLGAVRRGLDRRDAAAAERRAGSCVSIRPVLRL